MSLAKPSDVLCIASRNRAKIKIYYSGDACITLFGNHAEKFKSKLFLSRGWVKILFIVAASTQISRSFSTGVKNPHL